MKKTLPVFLLMSILMISACIHQVTATPIPLPATNVPFPATSTPFPATSTPLPATEPAAPAATQTPIAVLPTDGDKPLISELIHEQHVWASLSISIQLVRS